NVRAIFELKANTISASPLGGGADSDVKCISDKLDYNQIVAQGKELTFQAIAGEGYEFVEWRYVTVDGKTTVKKGTTSEDKSQSTVTFTMGDASATVYAVFQRHKTKLVLPEHTRAYYLNTEDINPFIAEGTELPVPDDNLVPEGAAVIIRTEGGYEADGEWSVAGVDTSKIRKIEGGTAIGFDVPNGFDSIKVELDTRVGRYGIAASSRGDSADIDITVNGKSPESLKNIEGGSIVEFEAQPHRGYVFSYWIVNGDKVEESTDLYTAVVKGNMNVTAVCEAVDGHKVTANIEGEGQVDYEIATASGRAVKGSLSKTKSDITVYEGESITFNTKPDNAYMPAYVIIDGKRTECRNYSYTVSNVTEDTEITIGLEAAVYYQINVDNSTDYRIESEDGVSLEDGFAVGEDDETVVLIKGVKDPQKLYVVLGATALNPQECGEDTYKVVVKDVKKDSTLSVAAEDAVYISTLDELKAYLRVENQYAKAVLVNDIELDEEVFNSNIGCYLHAVFDGNGHALYGPDMTSSSGRYYQPLFECVYEGGKVENLVIRDCDLRFDYATNSSLAILTRDNFGTIENCRVENIDFDVNNSSRYSANRLGVIACSNMDSGIIMNCAVRNVNVHGNTNTCAVSYRNEAVIRNCYVENITCEGSAITNYVFFESGSSSVDSCYYDQGGAGTDDSVHNGKNIWVDGKKKSAGEIAFLLNSRSQDKAWGMTDNEDVDYPVLLFWEKSAYVPVQVRFRGYTALYGKGIVSIPEEKESGVTAWACDDVCYGAGTENVAFDSDTVLIKVEDPESEYGVKVEYQTDGSKGTQYFKEIADALKFASKCSESGITITADKAVSGHIEINDTDIVVAEDVTLAIKQGGSIENNRTITLSKGAVIDNNGAFQNNEGGTLDLGEGEDSGSLLTNGKFMNSGTIKSKENITCINHDWGRRTVKKEATYTEDGLASEVCNACGKEEYFIIPRKEETIKLELSEEDMTLNNGTTKMITAATDPEEHIGRIYWSSDKDVVAEVKTQEADNSGAEAVITAKQRGKATITAEYRNEFGYSVKESVEVTVVPQDVEIRYNGETISDSAGKAGSIDLAYADGDNMGFTAECRDEEAEIKWSSSDESVMTVECRDGAVTLSPVKAGTADIIAEADGKQAVCAVRIIVPATEIAFESDAMTVRPGMTKQATAVISPADSNERLTWTSDNEAVAIVSDTGIVTAIREGKAAIKVTTEGALDKEKHSAEMTVTVDPDYKVIAKAKAKSNCTYTGKAVRPAFTVTAVTGETLVLNRDYTVTCTSNIKVGTVTATIKGAGEYAGKTTCTYRIDPKKTTLRSLTRGTKSFTAKWYKRSPQVTGYQVAYSTSKSFKRMSKKTIKSYKTTKRTIKKLKSKRTYYVKVRTYKKVGTKTYYSAWSNVKKIKVK
ncbi:MAG: Ig-like domain-containing protein, partial [Mogibacterium sp.]|nr:Ig-like domain-containing protein [Mogibacterium sp.]